MKSFIRVGLVPVALLLCTGNALATGSHDSTVTQKVATTSHAAPAATSDTATVHGVSGVIPSGSVTYSLFTDQSCSGATFYSHAQTLNSDGTVPSSDQVGPISSGSYGWMASYSGDANYGPSASSCAPVTISRGTLTLTTFVKDAHGGGDWTNREHPGARAYAGATFSGIHGEASGTFTYKFYTNGRCSGSPQSTTTTSFRDFSPTTHRLKAGSYGYRTTYSNDPNYNDATSPCASFKVVPKNQFKIFGAHVTHNGAVSFTVKLPGAGTFTVKGRHFRPLRRSVSRAGKFAVRVEPAVPGQYPNTTLYLRFKPWGGTTWTLRLRVG